MPARTCTENLNERRGAGMSNLTAGFILQAFGYPADFLTLAAIAMTALVFFASLTPEMRPGAASDGRVAAASAA